MRRSGVTVEFVAEFPEMMKVDVMESAAELHQESFTFVSAVQTANTAHQSDIQVLTAINLHHDHN